eukprot:COSAG02_NODE_56722_length_284_cov_0.778378_1_plen_84_part_10
MHRRFREGVRTCTQLAKIRRAAAYVPCPVAGVASARLLPPQSTRTQKTLSHASDAPAAAVCVKDVHMAALAELDVLCRRSAREH